MDDALNEMSEDLAELAAETFTTVKFDINRPDYTQVATPLTLLAASVEMHVEPSPSTFAHDRILGGEYFLIVCRRTLLQAGDIISPSSPHPSLGPMTVVNGDNFVDIIALKLGHLCSIYDSAGNAPLFSNVRFDYVRVDSAGNPDEPYMEGSLYRKAESAVLWKRGGDIKIGHRLYDPFIDQWWMIINVGEATNFSLLTLREDIS